MGLKDPGCAYSPEMVRVQTACLLRILRCGQRSDGHVYLLYRRNPKINPPRVGLDLRKTSGMRFLVFILRIKRDSGAALAAPDYHLELVKLNFFEGRTTEPN
jgi:hypothetical protein